VADLPVAGMED
jgi:hypothetical protein